MRNDHGTDQAGDVVERAQVGGVDRGPDAATSADNIGGGLVVLAVQIGAGEGRAWCVTLVQPGLVAAAGRVPARRPLGQGGAELARLFAFGRGLLCGLAAYRPFEPPLGGAAGGERLLLGPQLPPGLPELLSHLRAREIAAERRVRDAVVAGELPQRLAARPPPQQLRVGNQPAQSPAAFHTSDPSPRLTHHERTSLVEPSRDFSDPVSAANPDSSTEARRTATLHSRLIYPGESRRRGKPGRGPAPARGFTGTPILEIAGPREENLIEVARLLATHRGEDVQIEAVSNLDDPDALLYESGALLPGPDAILAGPTFKEWLGEQTDVD